MMKIKPWHNRAVRVNETYLFDRTIVLAGLEDSIYPSMKAHYLSMLTAGSAI